MRREEVGSNGQEPTGAAERPVVWVMEEEKKK